MNRICTLVLFLLLAVCSHAADSKTLVILPFENVSKAPGIEWIGEAFPEVIGQRLSAPGIFIVSRDDRLYAFERMGIPASLRPSRATLYRISEQMDADYVVLGSYNFNGQTFTATANLLDMRGLKLSTEMVESGPLVRLLDIQNALAWQLTRAINPALSLNRNQYLAASPAVRLDALENYIRGTSAATRHEKLRYFREAIKLNPNYTQAILHLAREYFAARDYDSAASWYSRIPRTEAAAREGAFFAGLSYYYSGDYNRAYQNLNFLASQLPLTEVYNNLGVVEARRGRRSAFEYFQKAVQADPSDADYRFNLAVALARAGDNAGAVRELKEVQRLRPTDAEAKSLLETLTTTAGPLRISDTALSRPKLPLERIKRNYDENSFRQLALEIQNAQEIRLSELDGPSHAAAHVEKGQEMLSRGFPLEAEQQFREAVLVDPSNAAAHVGLAQVLESNNNAEAARREAQAALRLEPTAAAYLVLANLDLKENDLDSARANVEKALGLEPDNSAALMLQRAIAARTTQGAQTTSQ